MIAVDTSALLVIVQGEPEEEEFTRLLDESDCFLPASVLVEASILTISRGLLEDLRRLLFLLEPEIIALDGTIAQQAAEAYMRYGKGRHQAKLNFGDCLVYATAQHLDLPLLFKGDDFIHTDVRSARRNP